MPSSYDKSILTRLADHPVARIVAYYVVLAVAVFALHSLDPQLQGVFSADRFRELNEGGGSLAGSGKAAAAMANLTAWEVTKEVLVAMVGSYLVMLPVAWVYMLTRSKKGFQQALVQTLIILPIVVSGVVILVRSSVALAFSLGGIVGAVAFRHRLDDTKDAMFIFLAIGVGVAAGVQVMYVALALSGVFNLVNLVLWWSDFGRMPAQLQRPVAERRLRHLREQANKTGTFVSMLDSQILRSMAPEQLEVLAERAWKRRRRMNEEIGVEEEKDDSKRPFDATLRLLVAPEEVAVVRGVVEALLNGQAKSWKLEAVTTADGGRETVLYKLRFKKSVPGPLLLESVRRGIIGKTVSVELT